jgi:hypothetical protein
MAFELLTNPTKTKSGCDISLGASVRRRTLTRKTSGKISFVVVNIGAMVAQSLSLTADTHRLAVMFGTGADKGKLAITVDNSAGQFTCRKTKTKTYTFTIPDAASAGRLKDDFATIELEKIEIVKLDPTNSIFGIIDISSAVK